MKRATSSSSSNPGVYRALKARIILRNRLKREPCPTEVLEHLRSNLNDNIPYKVVSAAFRADEEVCPKSVCLCNHIVKQ